MQHFDTMDPIPPMTDSMSCGNENEQMVLQTPARPSYSGSTVMMNAPGPVSEARAPWQSPKLSHHQQQQLIQQIISQQQHQSQHQKCQSIRGRSGRKSDTRTPFRPVHNNTMTSVSEVDKASDKRQPSQPHPNDSIIPTILPAPLLPMTSSSPFANDLQLTPAYGGRSSLDQSMVGRDEVDALELQVEVLRATILSMDQREKEDKEKAERREKELLDRIACLESDLSSTRSDFSNLQKEYADLLTSTSAVRYASLLADHATLQTEYAALQRRMRVAEHAHTGMPHTLWTRSDRCALCTTPFTFFNRRHHCRSCGDSCCASCSKDRALIVAMTNRGRPVRACIECLRAASEAKRKRMEKERKAESKEATPKSTPKQSATSHTSISVPQAPPMDASIPPPPAPPINTFAPAPPFRSPIGARCRNQQPPPPVTPAALPSSLTMTSDILSSVKLRPVMDHSNSSSFKSPMPTRSSSNSSHGSMLDSIRHFHQSGTKLRSTQKMSNPRRAGGGKRVNQMHASPNTIAKCHTRRTPSPRHYSMNDLLSSMRHAIEHRRQQIEFGSDKKKTHGGHSHQHGTTTTPSCNNRVGNKRYCPPSIVKRLLSPPPVSVAEEVDIDDFNESMQCLAPPIMTQTHQNHDPTSASTTAAPAPAPTPTTMTAAATANGSCHVSSTRRELKFPVGVNARSNYDIDVDNDEWDD